MGFSSNQNYSVSTGANSDAVFVTYFSTEDPTVNDVNFPVGKRWFNTTLNSEWILVDFSSNSGHLEANWQDIAEEGAVGSIITNIAGPVSANSSAQLFDNASTTTFTDGSVANTLKTEVQGPAHNLLIGAGTNIITTYLAPSSTVGYALLSQGSSADPAYGIVPASGGGLGGITGVVTANGASPPTAHAVTNHGILIGGASNVVNSLGSATNGQLPIGSTGADPVLATLTSSNSSITITNGAGSINLSIASGYSINQLKFVQFTGNGTYTPTSGMVYCIVEVQGAGGGGGGSSGAAGGAGGGGGGYAKSIFSAATIGVSQSITVGSGGSGGTTGNSGSTGGSSSIGALITCTGGGGGAVGGMPAAGGAGGTSSGTVNYALNGQPGGTTGTGSASQGSGGFGGFSTLGFGASVCSVSDGSGGTGYGGGGSGGSGSLGGKAGGNGANGVVNITEYIQTP